MIRTTVRCVHAAMRASFLFLLLVLLGGCRHGENELVEPGMPCDTTAVSYAADIVPLLQQHCALPECHVPGGDGTGDFTTYAGVLGQVPDGDLLQSIQYLPGAIPMPPSGNSIPACDIAYVIAWVNAGAQEN